MELDTTRIRQLLDKRDEIDLELAALFQGQQTKKPIRCGTCQQEGHSSRTCPQKRSD